MSAISHWSFIMFTWSPSGIIDDFKFGVLNIPVLSRLSPGGFQFSVLKDLLWNNSTIDCREQPGDKLFLNHIGDSPNFQDIFPIIYQHDLWCQRWSHPPSLQSGTLNILQAPNLGFFSQIISYFDKNFQDRPQHYLWCSTWPDSSSLHSGTINILQASL